MHRIRYIFLASFFFSLHMALLTYVNSSMLSDFASPNLISLTYILASILSLVFVTLAPQVVRITGNLKYISVALLSSGILLYLISISSGLKIIPLFILYFSLNSVVLYGLDLFLEHYSEENHTGNTRGLYMTLSNIGWVLAPLITGALQTKFDFSVIYLLAAGSIAMTLLVLFFSQRGFVDKTYTRGHLIDGVKILLQDKNIRAITFINFLLQLFFVIMVIYSPLYLTSIIGFSWKSLGIILSIMLLPFVIFPYPSGYIADKYLGEKEFIFSAFIIMGLATIFFSQLGNATLVVYAIVLFMTRMGASIVEVMSDSAFFKHVTDDDSSVISAYRNMAPIAYIIGPLIGGALLSATSYRALFFTLGTIMLLASIYSLKIKDTK